MRLTQESGILLHDHEHLRNSRGNTYKNEARKHGPDVEDRHRVHLPREGRPPLAPPH
jgi:hypothetical protein